jgi:hypothetical protein
MYLIGVEVTDAELFASPAPPEMRDVSTPAPILEGFAVAFGMERAVLDGEQHAVLVAPVAVLTGE